MISDGDLLTETLSLLIFGGLACLHWSLVMHSPLLKTGLSLGQAQPG